MNQLAVPPVRGEIEAETFMDNITVDDLAVLRPQIPYSEQRAAQETKLKAQDQTVHFHDVMELYLKESPPGRGFSKEFNIRGQHDWDEVIKVAERAKEKYEKAGEGVKGFSRKLFRILGDRARAIDPWTRLIPTENYLSVLCGALKLVLTVAEYRANLRENILCIFEKLHEFRTQTEQWSELFADDLSVRDHSLQVYIAVLAMVEAMIVELVGTQTFAKMRNAFKLGSRGNKRRFVERGVEETEADFRNAVKALRDRVNYLHLKQGNRIEQKVEHLTLDVRALLKRDVQDGTKIILVQHFQMAEWNDEYNAARCRTPIPDVNHKIRENMLAILDVPTRQLAEDIASVSTSVRSSCGPSAEQMQWLLRNGRFVTFLKSRRSDILSLSSRWEDYTTGRHSPLSTLCLSLIQSLECYDSADVISFFCGLHQSSNDSFYGPTGILKSLVAQLLRTPHHFELEFVNDPQPIRWLRSADLSTLSWIFKELIKQLPQHLTLFCIVDGLQASQGDRFSDTAFFISELQEVMTDLALCASFKVLITTCGMRAFVGSEPVNQLFLPEEPFTEEEGSNTSGLMRRALGVGTSSSQPLREYEVLGGGRSAYQLDEFE